MATILTINLNGDGILKEFPKEKIIHANGEITVSSLPRGMESGRPSVTLIIDLPDGRKVVAETSARLFVTAAKALEARYGNLLEG
jgi:hypothetical protein